MNANVNNTNNTNNAMEESTMNVTTNNSNNTTEETTMTLTLNNNKLDVKATTALISALASLTIVNPSELIRTEPAAYDEESSATGFMLILYLLIHNKRFQSLTIGKQKLTELTVDQIDRACNIYALKSGFNSFEEAIQPSVIDMYDTVKLSETETGLLFWLNAYPLDANWLNAPVALGINLDYVKLSDISNMVRRNLGPDNYTHEEHTEFIKTIAYDTDQFSYGPFTLKAIQYETCEYILLVSVNNRLIDFMPFASCEYELEQRTRETAGYWLLDHALNIHY